MRKRIPVATTTLLALCFIVFFALHSLGMENETEAAIVVGAYYKPFILAGEWWRLLTGGFVHISLAHILMNALSLWSLGYILEPYLGKGRFLLILLCSVMGGSLFLFAAGENMVAVGISGGLYGLMACYTYLIILAGGWQNPTMRRSLISTYIINFLINFIPRIAWQTHLGGFITGLILTALLERNEKTQGFRKHFAVAGLLFAISLGAGCYRNAYIQLDQRYYGTDQRVLQFYQQAGFQTHAQHMSRKLSEIYGFTQNSSSL